MPIEIFCCYAHTDKRLLEELKKHLTPLLRQGLYSIWNDTDISPGSNWEEEIRKHLDTAQIILLLVSPDFVNSDYCYSIEMERALKRHESGNALVIPIILRPVYWKGAPFAKLQVLPRDAKPITGAGWHNHDTAFLNVVEGIRKIVERGETSTLAPSPPIKENPLNAERTLKKKYDLLMIYSREDISWVKNLTRRLGLEQGLNVLVPDWQLIEGKSWVNAREQNMELSGSCAIFLGKQTSIDWFKTEFKMAINKQAKDHSFGVIPVILPHAQIDSIDKVAELLDLVGGIDFRNTDFDVAFYYLVCGAKKVPPGRFNKDSR